MQSSLESSCWPAAAPAYTLPATRVSAIISLAVAGDYLFWQEDAGLNWLVYMGLLVAAQLLLLPRHAPVRRTAGFWVAALGCLASGAAVAWYGSGAAVLAALGSGLLLVGLVNQPQLRLVGSAVLTAVLGAWPGLRALLGSVRAPRQLGARLQRGWFYGRLLGVPLLALGVFQLLFALANPRYAALSERAWQWLDEGLARLLAAVSVPHLLFLAACAVVAAGALAAVPVYWLTDREAGRGERVQRRRDGVASLGVRRPDFRLSTRRTLDLRKEWLAAVACFGLLNALLAAVNAVDVSWIWLGFRPAPDFDLTQFVHEGTYVLIFSILLAAGIMLWFFRRNLNFYQPGLKWLRAGATLWVLQNAFLAASVGLRNYYYITATGLAYKRIGVYAFLALTVFGLATLLLKIWQRRTLFSLLRLNSWAAYAVLLLLAGGNWEIWIARYNLQARFARLDAGFLLNMPPRVLPVLQARERLLDQVPALVEEGDDGYYHALAPARAHELLRQRLADFRREYPARDWQSRTGAAEQAFQALTTTSKLLN
ncbi:DUF4173 domain-containing protein [Hymenobacter sp. RP-2-7]|uniref:DUF4173 domain-containing protein n=1 Tax=Hymenobacter polaris TaxID=2682546 RepID=A0A7Y0ACA7_9BACT|nr:DUF4173 domain-containing protein [Hymenobacter polaris]NML64705.1 DUF4173 domain-containing protein [Hymenobacter polaris]